MKYLIVGLGNIGDEYANTRHNIGFMMVDAFAESKNATWEDKRYGFVARCRAKSAEIILLKPSTYMNLSGNAVRYWLQQEKIPVENMLIIVDDISLPFGTLRLRPKGSDAGHNGLKDVARVVGNENYARLRFGVGGDFPRGAQVDYVLGQFPPEEREQLPARIDVACDIIKSFCLAGIALTMNQYNKK